MSRPLAERPRLGGSRDEGARGGLDKKAGPRRAIPGSTGPGHGFAQPAVSGRLPSQAGYAALPSRTVFPPPRGTSRSRGPPREGPGCPALDRRRNSLRRDPVAEDSLRRGTGTPDYRRRR